MLSINITMNLYFVYRISDVVLSNAWNYSQSSCVWGDRVHGRIMPISYIECDGHFWQVLSQMQFYTHTNWMLVGGTNLYYLTSCIFDSNTHTAAAQLTNPDAIVCNTTIFYILWPKPNELYIIIVDECAEKCWLHITTKPIKWNVNICSSARNDNFTFEPKITHRPWTHIQNTRHKKPTWATENHNAFFAHILHCSDSTDVKKNHEKKCFQSSDAMPFSYLNFHRHRCHWFFSALFCCCIHRVFHSYWILLAEMQQKHKHSLNFICK